MRMSYENQELLILGNQLGLPPVFYGVRVIHLTSCLCCVFALLFLVLYIVPSVASAYGSFILDCQFVLPNVYLRDKQASKQ